MIAAFKEPETFRAGRDLIVRLALCKDELQERVKVGRALGRGKKGRVESGSREDFPELIRRVEVGLDGRVSRELTLEVIRKGAITRTLLRPTTLMGAIERLGFVQADPIRVPARAQDLILRQRVKGYRVGDLERRYEGLEVEEDCLINYGFLPRRHVALMHPREAARAWEPAMVRQALEVLAFVRERGAVHPREVERHLGEGKVKNAWGGMSKAATQLLDGMHYRGMLRVKRRDGGVRVYEVAGHGVAEIPPEERMRRARALIELVVRLYAPLPAASLTYLVRLLGYGAPHLRQEVAAVLNVVREKLGQGRAGGTTWYWPEEETPASWCRGGWDGRLRLLAPFDPVVWDRRRFECLWGWDYKFEAYVPAAKRRFGYYAMPMLWQGQVIGWANVVTKGGGVEVACGYVGGIDPRDGVLREALDEEVQRLREFLAER